jgi:hypothetical protein
MSMRERGSGGMMRDGATNTGLAAVIIVVAVVVAVVLLHHNNTTKAVGASATVTTTTTILPGHGSATTTTGNSTTGSSTGTGPTTTLAPGVTTTTIAPADVKVLVLNGASFALPLATEFTEKVKNLGYVGLTPNNAAAVVKSSQIYVLTTGYAPEADALAKSLGLSAASVITTPTTTAPLSAGTAATGANLVLVVGPDLAGKSSTTTATTTG